MHITQPNFSNALNRRCLFHSQSIIIANMTHATINGQSIIATTRSVLVSMQPIRLSGPASKAVFLMPGWPISSRCRLQTKLLRRAFSDCNNWLQLNLFYPLAALSFLEGIFDSLYNHRILAESPKVHPEIHIFASCLLQTGQAESLFWLALGEVLHISHLHPCNQCLSDCDKRPCL